MNFRLARDQVVYLCNSGKFVGQPRQAINFYAVMAAKRFQTRTEDEIEQLLRDKSSKSRKLKSKIESKNMSETSDLHVPIPPPFQNTLRADLHGATLSHATTAYDSPTT